MLWIGLLDRRIRDMKFTVVTAQDIGNRVLARLECRDDVVTVPASIVRRVKLQPQADFLGLEPIDAPRLALPCAGGAVFLLFRRGQKNNKTGEETVLEWEKFPYAAFSKVRLLKKRFYQVT